MSAHCRFFPLAFSSVVTVLYLPQVSIFLCHRVSAMVKMKVLFLERCVVFFLKEGDYELDRLSSWKVAWWVAWKVDVTFWTLKGSWCEVKWREVKWSGKEVMRGGRRYRDSILIGWSGLEPPELSYWPFVVPHNFRPRDSNPGTSDWEARMLTARLSNRGLFWSLVLRQTYKKNLVY